MWKKLYKVKNIELAICFATGTNSDLLEVSNKIFSKTEIIDKMRYRTISKYLYLAGLRGKENEEDTINTLYMEL